MSRVLPFSLTGARRRSAVAFAFVVATIVGTVRSESVVADGVAFSSVNVPFGDVLSRAKPLGAARFVLVEFFTEHCGLCRALERETFDAPEVARALRDDLCVRYDAEGENGRPVAERYRVRRFPTTLFLDASGDEIDRMIGFISPQRFVEETARIRAGAGTLKALRAAAEASPTDTSVRVAYGRKLVRAGDLETARVILEPLADAATPDAAVRPAALLGLAELSHRSNDARGARERLGQLIAGYPDAPESADGWLLRVEVELRDGAPEKALEAAAEARRFVRAPGKLVSLEETVATLERKKLEATVLRWGEEALASGDIESLHRAARASLDRRMNFGSAARWAEAAAKAIPDDPLVLETHAALLFESGSPERALVVGAKALALARDPDDSLRIARHLASWRAALRARPDAQAAADGSDALPPPPPVERAGSAPAPSAPVPVHPREGESERPACPPPPPEPKPPCR